VKRALLALPLLLAACGVQPTEVITGTPSTGAVLYMIEIDKPVPVVRATRNQLNLTEVLTLLTAGPTAAERDRGLTSQVPSAAGPFGIDGNTITVQVSLADLGFSAMEQIICTAAIPGPVTLIGERQTRATHECPV
jgi:hypothetical protein